MVRGGTLERHATSGRLVSHRRESRPFLRGAKNRTRASLRGSLHDPTSLSVWPTKRRCVPMSPPAKPPTCCGY